MLKGSQTENIFLLEASFCCPTGQLFQVWRKMFSPVILFKILTSSRCFSSWGVEHTAFALHVRVLITLYLQARLWLLSHCRYTSVLVGFLYSPDGRVLSTLCVTSVSINGMEPSGLVSSTANRTDESTEFYVLQGFFSMYLLPYNKSIMYISFPNPRRDHICCYGSVVRCFHVKICYHVTP